MGGEGNNYSPETLCLHTGYDPQRSEGAINPPVFLNSTYADKSAQAAKNSFQKAFNGEKDGGLIYERLNHPNAEIGEDRLVFIEPGAKHAILFTSGMSAISTTLLSLAEKDKTIVFSDPVYGGTYHFLTEFLRDKLGFKVKAIKTQNLVTTEAELKKIGKNLGILLIETPANPTLTMTDINETAKLAKHNNPECLVIIDNTFMGLFQQPFKVSPYVDIVVVSATKFISGHCNLTAGIVFTKDKHLSNEIKTLRLQIGLILQPFESYLLLNQVQTYKLRMEAQAKNATIIAESLKDHPKIEKIAHPSLLRKIQYIPGTMIQHKDPTYPIYKKQCTGPSSIITLWLKDADEKTTFKFLDEINKSGIIKIAVSLGGLKTLICHPASTTHCEMSPELLKQAGITDSLVRLSVGIEDPNDLIHILNQAFSVI